MEGPTSHNYLQPNPVQNLYFVPVYSTTRPRNAVDVVLQDDIPPLVGLSAAAYAPSYSYQPLSDYYASAASSQGFSQGQDDLTYRMRPNTNNVLNRTYIKYGPLNWSWRDFTQSQRSGTPVYGGRGEVTYPTSSEYRPVYNHSIPSYSSSFSDLYKNRVNSNEPGLGVYSSGMTPKYNRRSKQDSVTFSSRNNDFPFRKYKTEFTPFAPYKHVYESAKYIPNPDWPLYKPWGHKFRKARFIYVPEDQNSSKSIELERVMKEARLRELIKGVYSSSYGDSVASKVNNKECLATDTLHKSVKSIETETVVLHREAERRKPLSSCEKRKRNETLAIGLSKTNLLKSTDKVSGIVEEMKQFNDSFDSKSTKDENVIEIKQTLTQSCVTKNIKAEEQESNVFPVISEDCNSNIDGNENNDTTLTSIQIGCIEKATETPCKIEKDITHENKNQEEIIDKSKEILTEKEENSYFKEVVSGVIKSLAQSNCTENKEICEVTSSQTVINETNDISKVVNDQVKKDDVSFKEDSDDQESHRILEKTDQEETILQDSIKNNDQVKKEENEKEHGNQENVEIMEHVNLEENTLQNSKQIDDQDKQLTNIEEHVILENIRDFKNPEENITQNNNKVDCQIKEEDKLNNLNPQTSSTEENVNKEDEIANNVSNSHDDAVANTGETLENVEFCQNVLTDEETTTEIQTDVPEAENIDITVKVNIQTIPLGSVSEQEILDYKESEDIEKSECDEEVEEE